MALSEEDRRRIEEEEFRRVARERALQSADPPPYQSARQPPESTKAPNTNFQVGFGSGFTGLGVMWLFIFPPLGIAFLMLGATILLWANERQKKK